jgi:hypothetical protein
MKKLVVILSLAALLGAAPVSQAKADPYELLMPFGPIIMLFAKPLVAIDQTLRPKAYHPNVAYYLNGQPIYTASAPARPDWQIPRYYVQDSVPHRYGRRY